MKNTFLIVDASHLFNRSKYTVKGTPDEIAGMCLHIIFASLGKLWRVQKADHIIFAFDGKSWRKSVYAPYKRNRAEKRALATPEQQELDTIFYSAFSDFQKFITERTNCTVLYNPILEADDLVAGFIQSHPDDAHIVVSSDKDFVQLLADNVTMYDGIMDQTITLNGIFDYKNNPVKDKKTGSPKMPDDPHWSVFEKAVRGCVTDNVFAAYPGARKKGSKNKVGMQEAFDDRNRQGFSWNAFMLTRWTDHEGLEHRVLDDYNRNVGLVDLSKQPDEIRTVISETIADACELKSVPQLGFHFLKFCGKYELNKISDQANYFSQLLGTAFPK